EDTLNSNAQFGLDFVDELKDEPMMDENFGNEVDDRDSMAGDPIENQGRQTYSNDENVSLVCDMIETEGENEEEFDGTNLSQISSVEFLEDEEDFRERLNEISICS
ncbi:hypothetical protein PMAYCL1PPCAC_13995, partial [Pristionchus mayeri]